MMKFGDAHIGRIKDLESIKILNLELDGKNSQKESLLQESVKVKHGDSKFGNFPKMDLQHLKSRIN